MTKAPEKKRGFPSSPGEMTFEQLTKFVDQRMTRGEAPWPPRMGPLPWPFPRPYPEPSWVPDPLPPNCPVCGNGARQFGTTVGAPAMMTAPSAGMMASRLAGLSSGLGQTAVAGATITDERIWEELKAALASWKNRYVDVTPETKLASMAASGDGRFDILSAIARSPFFAGRGLILHYFQIGGDETLSDVVETIGNLLEDLGYMVVS